MFLDFHEIKSKHRIEDVARDVFNIQLTQNETNMRGSCPACNTTDPRALLITPDKGLFYCFAGKGGGDVIALTSHLKGISSKDAAKFLSEYKPVEGVKEEKGLKEIDLDHTHVLVEALGFTPEVAERVGIGFASKGLMRNHIAVPVRLPDGTLIGYIGIKDEVKVPKEWRLP